jgi:hypothetical protein
MDKTTEDIRKKKKTKLFNKVYTDLQNAINVSLKKKNKIHTVSNYKLLEDFEKQIDANYTLYEKFDEQLFEKCSLLVRVFSSNPQLSSKNKEVVWKYIQTLYSLVKEEKKEVTPVPKIDGLEGLIDNLMNNTDSGFKSIIDDISSQLQQATVGKTINEQTIVQDLLAGNLKSSGIDFQKIIESTSKNIQKKIEDGDIDGEKLTNTANRIKTTLGM